MRSVLPHASEMAGFSPDYSVWDVIWVLFVLAVIIAMIILILKFLGKRSRGWGTSPLLRSLGGYPLGTNKSVQVIEFGGRIYVLGGGENITMLDAITDSETVAALLARHEALTETAGPPLAEWLQLRMRKARKPQMESSANADGRSQFQQALEERLKELADRRQRAEQLLGEKSSEDRSDHP